MRPARRAPAAASSSCATCRGLTALYLRRAQPSWGVRLRSAFGGREVRGLTVVCLLLGPRTWARWPRCEGDAKSRARSRGSPSGLATLGLSCRQLARVGGGFISPPSPAHASTLQGRPTPTLVSRLRRGRGDRAGLRRAGDAWPCLRVSGRRPPRAADSPQAATPGESKHSEGSGRASRAWLTVMGWGMSCSRSPSSSGSVCLSNGSSSALTRSGTTGSASDRSRPLKKPYQCSAGPGLWSASVDMCRGGQGRLVGAGDANLRRVPWPWHLDSSRQTPTAPGRGRCASWRVLVKRVPQWMACRGTHPHLRRSRNSRIPLPRMPPKLP